ncbi:hypothetical protein ACFL9U_08675 [Thermodesulfobacteriota bacterium]
MKNGIIVFICLAFLASCATYPPPKIEDGRYLNFQYEFLFSVPEDWKQVERVPESLEMYILPEEISAIKIMFVNEETDGLISVMSQKKPINVGRMEGFDFKGQLEMFLEKRKNKFENAKQFNAEYFHEIHNLTPGDVPSTVVSEEIIFETDNTKRKAIDNTVMYLSHKKNTCFVTLYLLSEIDTFEENLVIYDRMLNSLDKLDVTD